jgi:hypothetical protein
LGLVAQLGHKDQPKRRKYNVPVHATTQNVIIRFVFARGGIVSQSACLVQAFVAIRTPCDAIGELKGFLSRRAVL